MTSKRKKIGLALSSGGARGLAHIGVLKVLSQNNIPIDFIAGSSIGAMIGGAYASHGDIDLIEKVYLESDWRRAVKMSSDVNILSGGLVEGKNVIKFIKNDLHCASDFNDLQIPFSAVATNIKSGKYEALQKGDPVEAIRASSSFPGVFKPVKIDDSYYLDGGLTNPVPVNVVRDMGADIVIAVYLERKPEDKKNKKPEKSIAQNLITSMRVMQKSLADFCVNDADVVIRPPVGDILWNQFVGGKPLVNKGEDYAKKNLANIKELIK